MSVTSILPPRRILVRGVNWLGDAVMTTPALLRLREKFPEAHLALLTPAKLAGLWKAHPAVDETLSFAPEEGLLAVATRLRAGNFDLALVLPNSPRSAMEVFLAGIPKRLGYARAWRNFFLTRTIPPRAGAVLMRKRPVAEIKHLTAVGADRPPTPPGESLANTVEAHQIHEYLHLAAALGADPHPLAPQLSVTPEEIGVTRKKFGLDAISAPVFGLNPGAEYGPAKRWPAERFIAAAQQVQLQTNCVWLLFGGQGDAAITSPIASALRSNRVAHVDLAGQTTLRELMALLTLSHVLLTNDTGPMHLAAALGTPVVVPFGSTSPELTGPGLPGDPHHRLLKSDAPCSPCFLRKCPIDFRCLKGIGTDRVVAAVVAASAP